MRPINISIFASSFIFGAFIPGSLAESNFGNVTTRVIGAPNSLDYAVYFGKVYQYNNKYTRHLYCAMIRKRW